MHRRFTARSIAAWMALVGAASCGREAPAGAPTEVVVSAAASLTDVLTDLAAEYGEAHPGVVVRNNFGASGALEQQIRAGAGVDLFVSAARRQMDALASDTLIDVASRRVLATNELVLVVPLSASGTITGLEDLAAPTVRRIAIGAPESVPAGMYAEEALRALELWPVVQPKVIFTTNVRQALTYAERGEVDAALVYRTDASTSRGVRVAAVAPPGSHAPIVYPVALTRTPNEEARRYLEFLMGPAGQAALRRYGFGLPGPDDPGR